MKNKNKEKLIGLINKLHVKADARDDLFLYRCAVELNEIYNDENANDDSSNPPGNPPPPPGPGHG